MYTLPQLVPGERDAFFGRQAVLQDLAERIFAGALSGARFVRHSPAMRALIVPRAVLLTPNSCEAQRLAADYRLMAATLPR